MNLNGLAWARIYENKHVHISMILNALTHTGTVVGSDLKPVAMEHIPNHLRNTLIGEGVAPN